uniref:Flagellar protein putative n=1 Tax=Albugo laibachii Nc14 TaxID=890382 RepID=F0X1R4_9STRA|nr:flagellar protein putative [Albugo laibachii Nc14]|eukprot:CCA27766.1 flagellar protein putative [Albugo laibachii Nc14]
MSEILRNWLQNDCNLSLPPNRLEDVFANAYHFGQVLFRLDFVHDKSAFRDSNTNTARIINFCRLHSILKPLNVHFDAQIAIGILSKKNGIAASVLFQLKLIAEEQTKQTAFGCLPSKFANLRPQRPFDTATQSIFEQSLRRHLYDLDAIGKEMEEPSISPQKEDLTAIKTQRLHDRRLRRHHMEVHPPPNTNLSSFPVT